MKQFEHGGDIYSYRKKYGKEPIDFSSNINQLGLPYSSKVAYLEAVDTTSIYPDNKAADLVDAIAKYENIHSSSIFCGNGAADIIFRIVYALRPKRALLIAPTFSEYEKALIAAKSEIKFHYLNEENAFELTDKILQDINDVDILFLCNPNNPTGCTLDGNLLEKIIQICTENHCTLVIDECFEEFTEGASSKKYLEKYKNLIIVKAFTKTFAMAGLRLGYCLTYNETYLKAIEGAGQSWSVSNVAQACGIAALNELDYLNKSKVSIAKERAILIEELKKLGCAIYGSKANYIFFKSIDRLNEMLEEKGFLIRDCSNYRALDTGFYRVAIRNSADNNLLISVLKEVLNG